LIKEILAVKFPEIPFSHLPDADTPVFSHWKFNLIFIVIEYCCWLNKVFKKDQQNA